MNNETKIKIALDCGLSYDGEIDENNDPVFCGTDKEWNAYVEELERQESISEFDLQEARRYGITNESWPDKVEDIKL